MFFVDVEHKAFRIQDIVRTMNYLRKKYSSTTNVIVEHHTHLGVLAGLVDAQLTMDRESAIKKLKPKLTELLCPQLVHPRSAPSISVGRRRPIVKANLEST